MTRLSSRKWNVETGCITKLDERKRSTTLTVTIDDIAFYLERQVMLKEEMSSSYLHTFHYATSALAKSPQ